MSDVTTAPVVLSTVYLLAATGGLEEPTFRALTDKEAAVSHEWITESSLLREMGDRVDVLQIDVLSDGTTITSVIESVSW